MCSLRTLVDTRDLFLRDRLVAPGELSKAEARRMLTSAKRRFSLPRDPGSRKGEESSQG
jgi:hypothetical protein